MDQAIQQDIPFLVIEPAKGEYKDKFGHYKDVMVYGTNKKKMDLLRINPFSFPDATYAILPYVGAPSAPA